MDELLLINITWGQEFSGIPILDLSLLPLVFIHILTVASGFLQAYSTDDKTSGLMEKRFSTVRDTQRGSQSYMEKRRWSGEIEVPRGEGGGQKGRVQSSQ